MLNLRKSIFVILMMTVAIATIGCDDDEGGLTTADVSSDGTSGVDTSGATDTNTRPDTSGADTNTSGVDTSGADTSGADTSGADTSGADTSGSDGDTTCTPTVTCETEGAECGTITDDCGDTVTCAECPAGETCDEPNNTCAPDACVPTVTCDPTAECGEIIDDCGQALPCGAGCDTGEACDGATLLCVADTDPRCGDGNLDAGEACDAGANNSNTTADACRTNCQLSACGDFVVDTGEACDDGTNNSDSEADACRTTCQPAACGDGVLDAGEACDNGASNSDTDADACRTTCQAAACGDGVTDAGEDCDDDNTVNNDACTNACGLATHCDACADDADCGPNALCTLGFCAVPCEVGAADACPTDYTCAEVNGQGYCAPDAGACEPVTDPCDGFTCNTPPAAECAGDSIRTFNATGTCDSTSGAPVCTYAPSDSACTQTPPAAECVGAIARTYPANGTCDDTSGTPACVFTPTDTDCAALGQTCNAGACVPIVGPSCDATATATGTPAGSANTTGGTNDFPDTTYAGGCSDGGDGNDVSFSWTPTTDGCYILDTEGSAVTDTILAVFDDCAYTTRVACDDDLGTGFLSRVRFDATAGTTYGVVVDGYGASNNGVVNLNINPCPPCEGVTCDTPDPRTCNAAGDGYIDYAATGTCDSTSGAPVCAYAPTETLCNTPPLASCNGDLLTTYAAAGTCDDSTDPVSCAYAPTVTDCAATGEVCAGGACVPAGSCAVSPIDLDIADAVGMAVADNTTVGAGNDFSTTCGSTGTSPDVSISWTVPADGCYVIDTIGSGFDTVLAQRSCADGTQVTCNDDAGAANGGSNGSSRINLNTATAGTEHVFVVEGYQGDEGDFVLNINNCSTCADITCTPSAPVCDGAGIRTFTSTCSATRGYAVCGETSTLTACPTPPTTCAADTLTTFAPSCAVDGSGNPTCGSTPTTTPCGAGFTCNAAGSACVPVGGPVCDATALATGTPAGSGNTTGGTNDVLAARYTGCSTGGAGNDITYGWTPTATGCYILDTEGSAVTDTILAVFDDCAHSTRLACDDDAGTGNRSRVQFTATAGTPYAVVVDGFGATNNGAVNLNINPCSTCASSPCAVTPAACEGDNLRTFTRTCSDTLGYAVCGAETSTVTNCTTPPPATCTGGVLTTYGAGTCSASPTAQCDYPSTSTPCASGEVCNAAGTACVPAPIEVIDGCPAGLCTLAAGAGPNGGDLYTYVIPMGVHPVADDFGTQSGCTGTYGNGRDLRINLDATGFANFTVNTCTGTAADSSVAAWSGAPGSSTRLGCNADANGGPSFCSKVGNPTISGGNPLPTALSGAALSVVVDEFSTGYWNNGAARTIQVELIRPAAVCGNNTREGAEVCDGTDLNSQTCITQGFDGGTLGCNACTSFDTSGCFNNPDFTVGFCRMQAPDTINDNPGDTHTVYGRVYVDGLTNLTPGNDLSPNLIAQFGFGPDGSIAEGNAAWTWADAIPNPTYPAVNPEANNDEYQYDWTLPSAGSYDYAYRFSGDGGTTWTYCDGRPEGSSNGYNPADAGQATVTAVVAPPNPFFSEYVEGTGNSKAIEIFNAGGTAIPASACTVHIYANGSATSTGNTPLTGIINPGQAYALCNSGGAATLTTRCNQTVGGGAVNFNGDDALSLICNFGTGPVTVDTFGQIGVDPVPGTGSVPGWTGGGLQTADQTLRRKCAITTGDTNGTDAFDPSVEWDGAPVDTFSDINIRTCP